MTIFPSQKFQPATTEPREILVESNKSANKTGVNKNQANL